MTKNKKRIIWLILIAAAIFGGYKYFVSKKPVTTYVTENVTRGDLKQTISSTGELNSNLRADLSFKATGRIESIKVAVGDAVVKGQKLAIIDKGTLIDQLNQAEADIKAQKKTLSDMNDKKSTITTDQRDSQRAVIEKFEAARGVVLAQIRETSLSSPINGTIITKNYDEGEVATASSPVLSVADLDDLMIESNIPEADIVKISVGQGANVVFDSLTDDDIFKAEIIEIDPAATVIQDVVYYRIKLRLADVDARLKIGMNCDVDVMTAEAKDVLMVSQRAVKTEGTDEYVTVLQVDGVATKKVFVETGLEGDEGMVEVKPGDLKEGDAVVTFTKAP